MDKIRKILSRGSGHTNEAEDMALVRKYVEDTAPRASECCCSGLFSICEKILNRTEPRGLKPKIVKVLHWQYDQMAVIDKLLKSLVCEGHLVEYHHHHDAQDAAQFVNGLGSDDSNAALQDISHRLWQIPEFSLLLVSPDPTFRVFFPDGHERLLNNLVLNRLRHEEEFRLAPIANAIEIFLRREFVPVVLECWPHLPNMDP